MFTLCINRYIFPQGFALFFFYLGVRTWGFGVSVLIRFLGFGFQANIGIILRHHSRFISYVTFPLKGL